MKSGHVHRIFGKAKEKEHVRIEHVLVLFWLRQITPACMDYRRQVDLQGAFKSFRQAQSQDPGNIWTTFVVLHCENDPVVPVKDAYTLYSAASAIGGVEKVTLHILESGGHAFTGTEPPKRLAAIFKSLFDAPVSPNNRV